MTPEDLQHRIRRDPASTALLFDFDGTLSSIVDDPAEAAPFGGVVALLDRLAGRYSRVAVVSGRPRSFLSSHFGSTIDLSGLYGLETRVDGVEADHPEARPWRPIVAAAAESARRALPDEVMVESKGFSLTVHFRVAPEAEGVVRTWAERVAAETGLEVRRAKASVELHPPVGVDKGTSVLALVRNCKTIVYVGDDIGDLPAFGALDELRRGGLDTMKVATGSAEMPVELADAADLVVPGPAGVVELFDPVS